MQKDAAGKIPQFVFCQKGIQARVGIRPQLHTATISPQHPMNHDLVPADGRTTSCGLKPNMPVPPTGKSRCTRSVDYSPLVSPIKSGLVGGWGLWRRHRQFTLCTCTTARRLDLDFPPIFSRNHKRTYLLSVTRLMESSRREYSKGG